MDNPFILLGIFIFFSFWWMDRSLKNWKKEQDQKLSELKESIQDLQNDFNEKFERDY